MESHAGMARNGTVNLTNARRIERKQTLNSTPSGARHLLPFRKRSRGFTPKTSDGIFQSNTDWIHSFRNAGLLRGSVMNYPTLSCKSGKGRSSIRY